MRLLLPVLLTSAALGLAACGDDPEPVASTAQTTADSSAAASTPDQAATAASTPSGTCKSVTQPAAKSVDVSKPSGSLSTSQKHLVTLNTSCGKIVIELDAKNDPKTANAFAHLVKEGYYDKTAFHRVVPGFVIQGGDPTGTGSGGPKWTTVEPPPSTTKYVAGVVAMAKSGDQPSGASGSQFFIVTGADTGLPTDYAVAGKVVEGQNVADLIAAQGAEGTDGPPSKPVVLTSATLKDE